LEFNQVEDIVRVDCNDQAEKKAGTRKLNRIERDTLLITGGAVVLAGIVTKSWISMFGILLGGVLMLANFHFLWRFSQRALDQETRRKGAYLAGLFLLFFFFLGAVAFSLLYLKVPIIPFFLGTLALLVSILLNSLIFV
jgi:hypothetical protein